MKEISDSWNLSVPKIITVDEQEIFLRAHVLNGMKNWVI